MFTGIIEDIGEIKSAEFKSGDAKFTFGVGKIKAEELVPGESISVNGACLTVVSADKSYFKVDVSKETLSKTNLSKLATGSKVNLERSLKAGARMGGHIVTGHIDGIGSIDTVKKIGESLEFWFSVPPSLSRYMIPKGSVAIDGVSLTVNLVEGDRFSVNIIPHTRKETIFSDYKKGENVNIECDIIGKYVEKFVSLHKDDKDKTYDLLKKL